MTPPNPCGLCQDGLQIMLGQRFGSDAEKVDGLPNKFGHGDVATPGFPVDPVLVFRFEIDEGAWHGTVRYQKYLIMISQCPRSGNRRWTGDSKGSRPPGDPQGGT